jgi:hypothetical protein
VTGLEHKIPNGDIVLQTSWQCIIWRTEDGNSDNDLCRLTMPILILILMLNRSPILVPTPTPIPIHTAIRILIPTFHTLGHNRDSCMYYA